MSKSKYVVVDSSVAVKWISNQEERFLEQSDEILKKAQKHKITK